MPDQLAILGGTPAVSADLEFSTWPRTDKADEELVLASLRQSSHAFGPHCQQLQKEFAEWNGNKHCIPTNSGTAALHMALAGCGVQAGDEVITTCLSWTSSATCIIHHNAIPIFVDVDWATMLMDPGAIEAAITPNTKAILVVHYWGLACDMDPIMAIAKKHNLKVIEDACQAHGALYKGKKVGTIGHAGAFSLNQNKNLCGGEGGLFVSDDDDIHRRARAVQAFGDMRPADSGRDYDAYGLGWMYRTSDLPAAFALSQLRKLDGTNAHAQRNFNRLQDALKDTPNLTRPYSTEDRPSNGYAYVLRVCRDYCSKRGVTLAEMSDAIIAALKAEGIVQKRANWLLPAHAVFQNKNAYGKGSPWTDGHARQGISYDLAQYPIGQQCIETCLWNINLHRPPNGNEQIDALAAAIHKVFSQLDELPIGEEAAALAAAK